MAADYQLESIAFPVLSSGSYRYPKDKALKIAMNAITDFLVEHDLLVYLVLYDRQALTVSKRLSASVKEYIDDHYVEEKNEDFRGGNGYPMASRRAPETSRLSRPYVAREAKERSVYLPDGLSSPELFREGAPDVIQEKMAPMFPQAAKRSLEELIAHTDETFSQMLLRLIDERGLKDSYVYKKANVNRRHFSKIRNDVDYAPNKKTVLAFAIALELSLDETKDLLMRAGFAFSCCSKFDVIICYFIENRQYDIFKINEMLFVYGQPILGE